MRRIWSKCAEVYRRVVGSSVHLEGEVDVSHNDQQADEILKRILHEEEKQTKELGEVIRLLKHMQPHGTPATSFTISQINSKGAIMAILGIQLGAVGQFTGVPSPAGSSLAAGSVPTWSADDTLVSLTASADGSAVAVQTSASDTATSFDLTQSGVSSNGAAIASTVNVPLMAATPVPATGFSISQIS